MIFKAPANLLDWSVLGQASVLIKPEAFGLSLEQVHVCLSQPPAQPLQLLLGPSQAGDCPELSD